MTKLVTLKKCLKCVPTYRSSVFSISYVVSTELGRRTYSQFRGGKRYLKPVSVTQNTKTRLFMFRLADAEKIGEPVIPHPVVKDMAAEKINKLDLAGAPESKKYMEGKCTSFVRHPHIGYFA